MDVFVQDEQTVPSLDVIEQEITSGLKQEFERLEAALVAENYYQGRGLQYLERRSGETEEQFKKRPKRTSKITRQVTRMLSRQLWAQHPMRDVEGNPAVSEWYQELARTAHLDVRLVAADRASILGHVAAIEIEATGNPDRPASLYVWKPHEFVVWVRDDDPADVWAVATRSRIRAGAAGDKFQTRIRVWTAFERRTYYSRPYGFGEPASGKSVVMDPEQSGLSPYTGVLPFTFVRFEPAVSEFWEGGLGPSLVEINGEADRALSDLAQHVQAFLNPARWAKGLPATARLSPQPDGFVHIPVDPAARVGDMRIEPELGYLQASLAVDQGWTELRNYVDQSLEELEIPATLVRTTSSSTDLSGVAIVAKQVPFYEHARARQPLAVETEEDLFARCCAVVGLWFQQPDLVMAAQTGGLMVTFPEPKIPLPTAERDQADQWELDNGFSDPIEILAKRRGITIKQAEALAMEIAQRREAWALLMSSANQAEMDAQALPPDMAGNEDQPEDDEEEVDDGDV